MPSISDTLDHAFRTAIRAAFGLDADPLISPSANPQFGDYQSNVAMGLTKRVAEATGAKANPRQVAEHIKAKLDLGDVASEVTIAGPGFLNVRLSPAWLATQLDAALADDRLGVAPASPPQTVVVDYSAPNVAKEMHVGHLRSTIIGDSVTRVLGALGHKVIRQNHIGDWGTQFGRVMLGLWCEAAARDEGTLERLDGWRRDAAAIGKADEAAQRAFLDAFVPWHQSRLDADPDGDRFFVPYYRDAFPDLERLQELYKFASTLSEWPAALDPKYAITHPVHGQVLYARLASLFATFIQQHRNEQGELHARHWQEGEAWRRTVDVTMATCQATYDRLGVLLTHADERGESTYNAMLPAVVADLTAAGIAEVSDGATVAFVEGFEAPLIVRKSDGGYGYATTDLAAIRYRVGTLGASRVIYVVGLPQSQHFAQVFAVAARAGWSAGAQLEHAGFGSVLGEDGKVFRTRGGTTVKLSDLLDEAEERALAIVTTKNETADAERKLPPEALPTIAHAVGIGAVKYGDLLRDRVGDYKFSFDAMLAMDGNTAPYLQYAHARIRSIFRKADVGGPALAELRVTSLSDPAEPALAKTLLRFAPTVEAVARELKPHFLCTYLYELSGAFSSFYDACPVLKSEEPTRSSRLALCELTARTIARGLDLLGIEHPDQM